MTTYLSYDIVYRSSYFVAPILLSHCYHNKLIMYVRHMINSSYVVIFQNQFHIHDCIHCVYNILIYKQRLGSHSLQCLCQTLRLPFSDHRFQCFHDLPFHSDPRGVLYCHGLDQLCYVSLSVLLKLNNHQWVWLVEDRQI